MLEEFLVPVYEDAKIVSRLRYVVELIRINDEHRSILELNKLLPEVCEMCRKYAELNRTECMELWDEITALGQIEGDIIRIGDEIESNILPKLQRYMSYWGHIQETDEVGLCLESSSSGFLTMKDVNANKYFHSMIDPMEEARKLAENIYLPEKKEFSVLGCGLGYLIYQLYCVSNGSIVINVFESDKRILEYAYQFGVLSWIPEECIRVITDEDILSFLNNVDNEDVGLYIFCPEMHRLPEEIRPIIVELYMQYSTPKKLGADIDINYWRNVDSDFLPMSKFDKEMIKDETIVVAAGPSLDDNMEFLRESKGKKTIIAVGTIFRKLVEAGIEPDLVVVMDPQKRTFKQLEGVENQKVPMILSLVTYWEFARKYHGIKYMVPVIGDKKSAKYAKEHNEELWVTGGTVTSLAIAVAVKYGAKKIYFVGIDMAYPGGLSHATGTMDRGEKDLKKLTPIEGVGGAVVYADPPFMAYREWIENCIELSPEIEYINMSKVGARIKGSKEVV